VVNIKAGAKTRLSGMLHSVIMLIVVVFLGTIAEKIPLCILAGILLKVGIDIIDWDFLRKLRFYPKDKVLLMFTVLILTIFSDLVTSIGLGLILSHMIYSKKMHKSQLNQIQVFEAEEDETPEFSELVLIEKENSRSARVKLSGSLNYSVVKDLTQLINNAAANRQNLILDFEDIVSIDISIASAIEDILKSLKGEKTVKLKIKQDETYNMLRSLGILKLIDTANIQILEKDGK
ncbi:MAG TPA: SulP family inorganic anion transporter, partial [Emcibacteraceae bacterium]|nr:SulP family inorganic anion transporter [Emcibacteraceae bacterium]